MRSDKEMREILAKKICEYLVKTGTAKTMSGNYHIEFEEVNKKFGTKLPDDKKLLDEICDKINYNIVADLDTTEDFDLMFYTAYCPNYCDEEEWW